MPAYNIAHNRAEPDTGYALDLTEYVNRLIASDEFISDAFWPNNEKAVIALIRKHMPAELKAYAQVELDEAILRGPRHTTAEQDAEDHVCLYEQYDRRAG